MDRTLSDIRILKLAEMYEHAFEAFVIEMASRYVSDDDVRAKLTAIAGPMDQHGERIARAIERLDIQLGKPDRDALERAALLDVLEVERAARAFYVRFVEEIHDPEVARLFRELASEEARHVRIAEDALAINDRKGDRSRQMRETERLLRLLDEAPPGREGASDFGRSRLTKT